MREYLDLKVRDTDIGDVTIKEYLKELLLTLWKEGESCSGKRPFGNSGWEFDLYVPLIEAGAVEGTLDEEGYIETFKDYKKAYKIIADLIELCFLD